MKLTKENAKKVFGYIEDQLAEEDIGEFDSETSWTTAVQRTIKMFEDDTTSLHGSPEDRGSADRYYHRGYNPHWYPNGTGNRPRILKQDMSEEEIALYKKGWDGEQERKEW